jgi:8-oxo-dGTP pyrophosphatase MutT (NUDIX family)
MEPGESPDQAATREAGEEAGKSGQLVPVWTFQHPSGFKFYNYLAVVPNEFVPKKTWETRGHRWVEPGQWPEPMHPGLRALVARPEFAKALEGLR